MLTLVADEPMPMSQLAGRLKCEPSNITGLVDRMEKRGLVTWRAGRAGPADQAGHPDAGRPQGDRGADLGFRAGLPHDQPAGRTGSGPSAGNPARSAAEGWSDSGEARSAARPIPERVRGRHRPPSLVPTGEIACRADAGRTPAQRQQRQLRCQRLPLVLPPTSRQGSYGRGSGARCRPPLRRMALLCIPEATPSPVSGRASTPATSPASWPRSATGSRSSPGSPTRCSTTGWASRPCPAWTCTGSRTRSTPRPSEVPGLDRTCWRSAPGGPRASPSRARSRCARPGCWPPGPASSTSCTTTSASATGCCGCPGSACPRSPPSTTRWGWTASWSWPRRRGWRAGSRCCRWYGFTRMQKRVARRLPEIITVSSSSAAQITEYMGVRPDRIRTIPIGTDVDRYRPPDPATVAPVPGRIVTTASADSPLKGLAVLIEAFAKVRAEYDHAHLVVVGKPKKGGPALRAIEEYGLAGSIDLHRQPERGRADRHPALRRDRLRALPVRGLLAARGRGDGDRPAAGGHDRRRAAGGDRARTARPCCPCRPGDAPALAAALVRLLGDPGAAGQARRRGRERAATRFTWRAAAVADRGARTTPCSKRPPPRRSGPSRCG